MALKLFGMLKKPVQTVLAPLKKANVKQLSKKAAENQYMVLSTTNIPSEYFCELHPSVRKQLMQKLASEVPSFDGPVMGNIGRKMTTVI